MMDASGSLTREKKKSRQDAVVRAATPADAKVAAELIYLPMGRLADHLFGDDHREQALRVIGFLFSFDDTRFSHRFCDIFEVKGKVAALLLSYPAQIPSDLAGSTGRRFKEILGVRGMARMLRRSIPFIRHREAEQDEYYVFTVAALPRFQGNGLGKVVMALAEQKAREAGLTKISLGVTLNNHRAIRFYSRLGFNVVETVRTPGLMRRIRHPGYCKMLKELS